MGLKAVAGINQSAVAITGGTIAGTTFSTTAPNTGVPTVLYAGGVPFIGLSSGSVAANGAISGITALPRAYPNAYCYFPANALATSIVAGWYYCTFSTTTAGVAFLNTYTSGVPTIPSSPTAVTDGKGAFTGDTGEEFGPTITVPALTVNSLTRYFIDTEETNNANSKTLRIRQSGSGGTIFLSQAAPSVARAAFIGTIMNTGATGKQISGNPGVSGGNAVTNDVLGTVDTSVGTTVVISLQRATATDNYILLPPIVELIY